MYYLVIIQNGGAENQAVAVYAHEDIDNALSAYHSELAYRGEGRDKTTCVILDVDGFEYCHETWAKKVEQEEHPES